MDTNDTIMPNSPRFRESTDSMTSTGSASSKSDGFNHSPGSVGDQQDHRPQMDMSTSEKGSGLQKFFESIATGSVADRASIFDMGQGVSQQQRNFTPPKRKTQQQQNGVTCKDDLAHEVLKIDSPSSSMSRRRNRSLRLPSKKKYAAMAAQSPSRQHRNHQEVRTTPTSQHIDRDLDVAGKHELSPVVKPLVSSPSPPAQPSPPPGTGIPSVSSPSRIDQGRFAPFANQQRLQQGKFKRDSSQPPVKQPLASSTPTPNSPKERQSKSSTSPTSTPWGPLKSPSSKIPQKSSSPSSSSSSNSSPAKPPQPQTNKSFSGTESHVLRTPNIFDPRPSVSCILPPASISVKVTSTKSDTPILPAPPKPIVIKVRPN